MGSKKAKPSEADRAAAQRLRAEWDARARGLALTQDKMAARMGGTQGLVSQYLNGFIPLNYRALMHFAEALGVDPLQIRDDLPEQAFVPSTPSRGSHAARPDADTIRNAQHALLTFLRRRDPDATLDLLDPADAELFAGALEIIQGGDDQITVSAQVADLVEAYEGRRGKRTEGEQDGGAARGKARKSGAR